ncbi:hypothetical protein [Pediococcus acidilactici]|uniref:hypothetical protein n=1 Tax=Pediococcus acidilactici TaxID=1254 RepID=UPI000FFE1C04|nr:hypothetical protein [Pediococcus acidilactici]QAT20858.1 hypothetical protein EQZ51_04985 [Pediococcus acidilactici]
MSNVKENLYEWLQQNKETDNVNINLLTKLVNPSEIIKVDKNKVDDIYPFLLQELKDDCELENPVRFLKQELDENKQDDDYQLKYLKFCFDLLPFDDKILIEKKAKKSITLDQDVCTYSTADFVYELLLYFSIIKEKENNFYEKFLSALMIIYAKKYNLRFFSVLCEAYTLLPDTDEFFLEETISFIEEQQTNEGYFGYEDPFQKRKQDLTDRVITSFHMFNAWNKLQVQKK